MNPFLLFQYITVTALGLGFAAVIAIPIWLMWRAVIEWALSGAEGDGLPDGEANA